MKWIACIVPLAVCVAAWSEDVKFTSKPSVVKSGDKTMISFSVSAPTDVEVGIQDSTGKVIRHLVAGVLGGKNPPPEPLKPGLSQNVEWDGKDDTGKTAAGGSFKVHVGLGMKPQFDSFLLHNPDGCGYTLNLAVGPAGTLYAFHGDGTANGNMGGMKLKVFNREGKHLKALMPFPADIAPAKLKALGVFQTSEGDLVPHVYNTEQLSFYPDTVLYRGHSSPYCSPAVDSKGRVYWMIKHAVICCVDADGGIPFDTFLGPKLLPDIKDVRLRDEYNYGLDHPCLAVSSDDKYIYFAGLSSSTAPLPCVFRVEAEKRGPGEVFIGKLGQPGTEKDLITAPHGLAVAKGLIYVADYKADRVAVFKESDRSYVGEIKVKAPDTLGVDPATEAVYVCSAVKPNIPEIVKFDSYKSGKALYKFVPPAAGDFAKEPVCRIAVDASAKPVRIWIPGWPYSDHKLMCIDDNGTKFVNKGDPRSKELWAEGARDLSVDRVRDEVYIKANYQHYYRVDNKTGKVMDTLEFGSTYCDTVPSTQLVPGIDGNLYTLNWGTGMWRFDHGGKPLNWEGQSTARIPIGGQMCFQIRQLALKPFAPPDELYIVAPNQKDPVSLNVIGQDGKTRRTVVWQVSRGAVQRVDAKGNIYVADMPKPADRSYPEFFDGKLAPPPPQGEGGDLWWNSNMYGSIIKFPPSGGIIWYQKEMPACVVGTPSPELLAKPKVPGKVHMGYHPHGTCEVQGALWTRFGYSPFANGTTGMTAHCMCEGSGFDVDPYGRVFFPNLGQFRVEVIDTNNNPITTFGKYGNEDSGGKDAVVKKPEIPLAWPNYVAVTDTHAYVSDTVNRHVVRVKLSYAAEATCPAQ
jgi:hypothetical protein